MILALAGSSDSWGKSGDSHWEESSSCYLTRNAPSRRNFISPLTWLMLTGASWHHTERAELVDGFDDAFALLGACAAAPFTVQGNVQQLLLLLLDERNTLAQLIRKRGCKDIRTKLSQLKAVKTEGMSSLLFFRWAPHFRFLPSSGMGSISQGLIFSVSPLSQLDGKQGWIIIIIIIIITL